MVVGCYTVVGVLQNQDKQCKWDVVKSALKAAKWANYMNYTDIA
jgi:hypothetical protein